MPAEFYFKFLFLAGFIGLLILAVCLVYSLFANRNFTCVCVTNTYFFFKRFFGSDAWADNEKAFEDAEAVAVDFLTVKLNSDDVAVSLCVCVCVCVCVCANISMVAVDSLSPSKWSLTTMLVMILALSKHWSSFKLAIDLRPFHYFVFLDTMGPKLGAKPSMFKLT